MIWFGFTFTCESYFSPLTRFLPHSVEFLRSLFLGDPYGRDGPVSCMGLVSDRLEVKTEETSRSQNLIHKLRDMDKEVDF